MQVPPTENNVVHCILLAIADPQPIKRTERACDASDRLNLRVIPFYKLGNSTTFVNKNKNELQWDNINFNSYLILNNTHLLLNYVLTNNFSLSLCTVLFKRQERKI